MNCIKCGKNIDDNNELCPQCEYLLESKLSDFNNLTNIQQGEEKHGDEEIKHYYQKVVDLTNANYLDEAAINIRHILEEILKTLIIKYAPENTYDDMYSQINVLNARGIFDKHLTNTMHSLRTLANKGAHKGKDILTARELSEALVPLKSVIEWYFQEKSNIFPMGVERSNNVTNTLRGSSEKARNMLMLARNAKNDGNYKEAETYYRKVLAMEELNFEAFFYSAFCNAVMDEDMIRTATKMSQCLTNTFYMASMQYTSDKEGVSLCLGMILIDVFKVGRILENMAYTNFENISWSLKNEYKLRVLMPIRIEIARMLYKAGELIEKYFLQDESLRLFMIDAWKEGVEIHKSVLPSCGNDKQIHMDYIKSMVDRIKFYDSTYLETQDLKMEANSATVSGVFSVLILGGVPLGLPFGCLAILFGSVAIVLALKKGLKSKDSIVGFALGLIAVVVGILSCIVRIFKYI